MWVDEVVKRLLFDPFFRCASDSIYFVIQRLQAELKLGLVSLLGDKNKLA
jgi:hypothetical protein